MKIVIPGGSGQVGTILARAFQRGGHDVAVLSRQPQHSPWRVLEWDGATLGNWQREIDGCDVVINLAGRSVNCRYNAANRHEIVQSRIASTRAVGEAIGRASHPPPVWLQASTATIYAHRYESANDERSGIIGGAEPDAPDTWRFSIEVARAWERACNEAVTPATRKVLLRSAMTMSPDEGGVFDALLGLVRLGLGGSAGTGRQFVSWIHYEDFVAAVRDATGGAGADVILDIMGASYLGRNLAALATGGRLVVIGRQGGSRAEIDLGVLQGKQASLHATTLRARPVKEKAAVVAGVREHVWPLINAGKIAAVIDRELPMSQASHAHRAMAASEHIGKILLRPE